MEILRFKRNELNAQVINNENSLILRKKLSFQIVKNYTISCFKGLKQIKHNN